jgi:hypothetical protein
MEVHCAPHRVLVRYLGQRQIEPSEPAATDEYYTYTHTQMPRSEAL